MTTQDLRSHTLNQLRLMFEPGDVVEIRALLDKRAGTYASGYFNDYEKLADAAQELSGRCMGVYVTLNPVSPSLMVAGFENQLEYNPTGTTSDNEITCRRNLLIDIDPDRPSGVSSTEAEHQSALDKALEIRDALISEGWPKPLLGDSGNGAHLIFRLPDLPNNAENKETVKAQLKAILAVFSARWSGYGLKIDGAVFNASRVTKLYGTATCKGENTEERPHRYALIEGKVPEKLYPVSVETLNSVAKVKPVKFNIGSGGGVGTMDKFIERYSIPNRGKTTNASGGGGSKWVLYECPFDKTHAAKDASLFESAAGIQGFKCFHDSCKSRGFSDVRTLFYNQAKTEEAKTTGSANTGNAGQSTAAPKPPVEPEPMGPETYQDSHANSIALRFLVRNKVISTASGMYLYNGTHWGEMPKAAVLSRLLRQDDVDAVPTTQKRRNEAFAYLESRQWIDMVAWRNLENYEVPFLNGVLNLTTSQLRAHRPSDYLETVIPHDYVPGATSQLWEKCLADYFGDDADYQAKVSALQEFFGYILMPHARYKKGLMLFSKNGDTGKSTVKEIAEFMVGMNNTCHIGLDRMEDRFVMAGIVGKLLNSVGEQSSGTRIADGRFKELVGTEEQIPVERKGKESFMYAPIAKHLVCTNNLPRVDDTSNAVYNRLLILKFNKVITVKNTKIWDDLKAEFSGILAWATDGAKRLYKNDGVFTVVPESVALIRRYKDSQNLLGEFLDEHCDKMPANTVITPKWRISKVDLLDKYRLKTRDERITPQAFSFRLTTLGVETKRGLSYDGKNVQCVEGYRWKTGDGYSGDETEADQMGFSVN